MTWKPGQSTREETHLFVRDAGGDPDESGATKNGGHGAQVGPGRQKEWKLCVKRKGVCCASWRSGRISEILGGLKKVGSILSIHLIFPIF